MTSPNNLILTENDFRRAAAMLDCDVAAVRAVAEVEARGEGFLPDGRPQVLYEAHIFHQLTGGRFAGELDRNGLALSSPRWNRDLYGRAGAAQHDRLKDAAQHHWSAANKACSWGMFQILGSNHAIVGYPTIQDFIEAMYTDAGKHLDAFVAFVKAKKLDDALRRHDWEAFARGYNGGAFAKNQYDRKLADAYMRWSQKEEEIL